MYLIGQIKLKLNIRYWINSLEVTDEPDKINSCTTGTKKTCLGSKHKDRNSWVFSEKRKRKKQII